MAWRLARTLEVLRSQVNELLPHRDKSSDGSIGDASHASRSSDHNPWVKDGSMGIVTAIDITHDPVGGFDSYAFAEMLRVNRDPRLKYVISNHRIFSSEVDPWKWRGYNGSNPHDHHVHISVLPDKAHYDSELPWRIGPMVVTAPMPIPHDPPGAGGTGKPARPLIMLGAAGNDVAYLQRMLGISATGVFDETTENAVIEFQKRYGLAPDGRVGVYTWRQLEA